MPKTLEDLATQPRSPKQPPSGNVKSYLTPEATLLRGNTVMGYSLRQPSNEGNACYDGFLGHPVQIQTFGAQMTTFAV